MKNFAWETVLWDISEEKNLSENDIYWVIQISNLLNSYYATEPNEMEFETLQKIISKLRTLHS
jgi:hypothetical protein